MPHPLGEGSDCPGKEHTQAILIFLPYSEILQVTASLCNAVCLVTAQWHRVLLPSSRTAIYCPQPFTGPWGGAALLSLYRPRGEGTQQLLSSQSHCKWELDLKPKTVSTTLRFLFGETAMLELRHLSYRMAQKRRRPACRGHGKRLTGELFVPRLRKRGQGTGPRLLALPQCLGSQHSHTLTSGTNLPYFGCSDPPRHFTINFPFD